MPVFQEFARYREIRTNENGPSRAPERQCESESESGESCTYSHFPNSLFPFYAVKRERAFESLRHRDRARIPNYNF
jgi:hypothetical protein